MTMTSRSSRAAEQRATSCLEAVGAVDGVEARRVMKFAW
jgi:hypothetical protein